MYINLFRRTHYGNMPVRVLLTDLPKSFSNINPNFSKRVEEIAKKVELNNNLELNIEKDPVKSPKVGFGTIVLQETFFSYLWAITFSMTVLYTESIHKQSHNRTSKKKKKINFPLARDAYKLWEYATRLIESYETWPADLPNPEFYKKQYAQLINKVNILFYSAANFVLAHEYAHIELQHDNSNIENESEADDLAIKLMFEGVNQQQTYNSRFGGLIGLCSLIFFNDSLKGRNHPDADDRVHNIIELCQPDESDAMWGIAELSYKLWCRHYNIKLDLAGDWKSEKHIYLSIRQQLKETGLKKSSDNS